MIESWGRLRIVSSSGQGVSSKPITLPAKSQNTIVMVTATNTKLAAMVFRQDELMSGGSPVSVYRMLRSATREPVAARETTRRCQPSTIRPTPRDGRRSRAR